MKKQVSVFGLHTRAALNRLLLAALGLLAVELILAGVSRAEQRLRCPAADWKLRCNIRSGPGLSRFRCCWHPASVQTAGTAIRCSGCGYRSAAYSSGAAFAIRSALRSCGVCRSWQLWARHSGTQKAPCIRLARRACLWISTAAAFCMGFCRWQTGMYGRATHCSCWRWAA